jgi:hypothetical protein
MQHIKQTPAPSGTGARENDVAGQRVDRESTNSRHQKQRGGKAPRQAGNRVERAITKGLQDKGFAAERIPLSGSAGGSFLGDISLPLLGVDRCVEVKSRRDGFKQLYDWLQKRDVLIVKRHRDECLVIVRMSLAIEVARKAEGIS